SQGILKAWADGILTSTTAMINIEGALGRVIAARSAHPSFPIGLHLNITQGHPVLPAKQVPSLVDEEEYFFPFMDLIEHLHQVSFDELRLECFAQAELFTSSGFKFDHIDSHQAFPAAYEPFFPVVLELAQHYRVPVRNPIPGYIYGMIRIQGKSTRSMALLEMARFVAQKPRLSFNLLPRMTPAAFKRTAIELTRAGIPTTNLLVEALYENPRLDAMIAIIEQLPPGVSEVACHPGVVDDALRQMGYGYVEPRSAELAVLLDPQVKAALQRCQVRLVDFSFLGESLHQNEKVASIIQ
ncbi:MAG TPA: ChbG/HpnK family deacetylase, partial [Anaerolineales bacterium]|nr:ChbG/HpnK family deacetylase [Anaerolineales bacterium]